MTVDKNKIEDRLALGLGWFSIGLGLAEVLVPRAVAKASGMKKNDALTRIFGLREIAAGVGLLTQEKKSKWLWARVAGDALDLAVLGSAISSASSSKKRTRAIIATATVAGVTALDIYCAQQLSKVEGSETLHVTKTLCIDRSPEDLYNFWRNFEQLGEIMSHLVSVQQISGNRWHWIAKAPAGKTVEWDAEITDDVPNHLIAWKSLPGADVDNWGVVRFEPSSGGRGTVVRVEMEYRPPAGVFGATIAKLFGKSPEQQISVDLRRFKQLMETGEIARTNGQPAGRAKSLSKYDEFVQA